LLPRMSAPQSRLPATATAQLSTRPVGFPAQSLASRLRRRFPRSPSARDWWVRRA